MGSKKIRVGDLPEFDASQYLDCDEAIAEYLTAILALMRHVPADKKAAVGSRVNAFKNEVEAVFEARLREIARAARDAELRGLPLDLSLPGRTEVGRGHARVHHRHSTDWHDAEPVCGRGHL